jgi:hypothetical protein
MYQTIFEETVFLPFNSMIPPAPTTLALFGLELTVIGWSRRKKA